MHPRALGRSHNVMIASLHFRQGATSILCSAGSLWGSVIVQGEVVILQALRLI